MFPVRRTSREQYRLRAFFVCMGRNKPRLGKRCHWCMPSSAGCAGFGLREPPAPAAHLPAQPGGPHAAAVPHVHGLHGLDAPRAGHPAVLEEHRQPGVSGRCADGCDCAATVSISWLQRAVNRTMPHMRYDECALVICFLQCVSAGSFTTDTTVPSWRDRLLTDLAYLVCRSLARTWCLCRVSRSGYSEAATPGPTPCHMTSLPSGIGGGGTASLAQSTAAAQPAAMQCA